MNAQFEFADHALQPLSGIVEAMHAAGVDRHCREDAMVIDTWERDDDRERPLPGD